MFKSAGLDAVYPSVIKELAEVISEPLMTENLWRKGEVSDDRKRKNHST